MNDDYDFSSSGDDHELLPCKSENDAHENLIRDHYSRQLYAIGKGAMTRLLNSHVAVMGGLHYGFGKHHDHTHGHNGSDEADTDTTSNETQQYTRNYFYEEGPPLRLNCMGDAGDVSDSADLSAIPSADLTTTAIGGAGGGIGIEISKNIVLSGCQSIHLIDGRKRSFSRLTKPANNFNSSDATTTQTLMSEGVPSFIAPSLQALNQSATVVPHDRFYDTFAALVHGLSSCKHSGKKDIQTAGDKDPAVDLDAIVIVNPNDFMTREQLYSFCDEVRAFNESGSSRKQIKITVVEMYGVFLKIFNDFGTEYLCENPDDADITTSADDSQTASIRKVPIQALHWLKSPVLSTPPIDSPVISLLIQINHDEHDVTLQQTLSDTVRRGDTLLIDVDAEEIYDEAELSTTKARHTIKLPVVAVVPGCKDQDTAQGVQTCFTVSTAAGQTFVGKKNSNTTSGVGLLTPMQHELLQALHIKKANEQGGSAIEQRSRLTVSSAYITVRPQPLVYHHQTIRVAETKLSMRSPRERGSEGHVHTSVVPSYIEMATLGADEKLHHPHSEHNRVGHEFDGRPADLMNSELIEDQLADLTIRKEALFQAMYRYQEAHRVDFTYTDESALTNGGEHQRSRLCRFRRPRPYHLEDYMEYAGYLAEVYPVFRPQTAQQLAATGGFPPTSSSYYHTLSLLFCMTSVADTIGVAAVGAGVAAQEVIKGISSRYRPISQFWYADFRDVFFAVPQSQQSCRGADETRCDHDFFDYSKMVDVSVQLRLPNDAMDMKVTDCVVETSPHSGQTKRSRSGGGGEDIASSASLVLPTPIGYCGEEVSDCTATTNNKYFYGYGALQLLLGKAKCDDIANQNVFLVGAGAIGCEYLKNFALSGVFGTGSKGFLTVTDYDHIENSNLCRQFLFRGDDVGRPKSTAACESVLKHICSVTAVSKAPPAVNINNKAMKIRALTEKVTPESCGLLPTDTDSAQVQSPPPQALFDFRFWKQQDIICTAVDNLKARLFLDMQGGEHGLPLIDSGTQGPRGHVEVICPYATKRLADLDKDEGGGGGGINKKIPFCSLHYFPSNLEHCVQFATDFFASLFTNPVQDVNKVLEVLAQKETREATMKENVAESLDSLFYDTAANQTDTTTIDPTKGSLLDALYQALVVLQPRKRLCKVKRTSSSKLHTYQHRFCYSFLDCIIIARRLFETSFVHNIRNLLENYPPPGQNQDEDEEENFWVSDGNTKRQPPLLLAFDANHDEDHLLFVASAAWILSRVFHNDDGSAADLSDAIDETDAAENDNATTTGIDSAPRHVDPQRSHNNPFIKPPSTFKRAVKICEEVFASCEYYDDNDKTISADISSKTYRIPLPPFVFRKMQPPQKQKEEGTEKEDESSTTGDAAAAEDDAEYEAKQAKIQKGMRNQLDHIRSGLIEMVTAPIHRGTQSANGNTASTSTAATRVPIATKPLTVTVFEKDDPSNGHIEFVASTANIRASAYRIPVFETKEDEDEAEESSTSTESNAVTTESPASLVAPHPISHLRSNNNYMTVKRIAGNIIPAMVTTTAVVTGLATLQALQVMGCTTSVAGTRRDTVMQCCRNTAGGLHDLESLQAFQPPPPRPTPLFTLQAKGGGAVLSSSDAEATVPSFTTWDRFELKTLYGENTLTMLIQDVIAAFATKYHGLRIRQLVEKQSGKWVYNGVGEAAGNSGSSHDVESTAPAAPSVLRFPVIPWTAKFVGLSEDDLLSRAKRKQQNYFDFIITCDPPDDDDADTMSMTKSLTASLPLLRVFYELEKTKKKKKTG